MGAIQNENTAQLGAHTGSAALAGRPYSSPYVAASAKGQYNRWGCVRRATKPLPGRQSDKARRRRDEGGAPKWRNAG